MFDDEMVAYCRFLVWFSFDRALDVTEAFWRLGFNIFLLGALLATYTVDDALFGTCKKSKYNSLRNQILIYFHEKSVIMYDQFYNTNLPVSVGEKRNITQTKASHAIKL